MSSRECCLIEAHRNYIIFENDMKYYLLFLRNITKVFFGVGFLFLRTDGDLANNLVEFLDQLERQAYMKDTMFTSVEAMEATAKNIERILKAIILKQKKKLKNYKNMNLETFINYVKENRNFGALEGNSHAVDGIGVAERALNILEKVIILINNDQKIDNSILTGESYFRIWREENTEDVRQREIMGKLNRMAEEISYIRKEMDNVKSKK